MIKTALELGTEIDGIIVVGRAPSRKGYRCYLFRCHCGNEFETRAQDIISGRSKSCGCLRKVRRHPNPENRGCSGEATYRAWAAMLGRGKALGTPVCDEWASYLTFRTWAFENGFVEGLSLDRRDNELGYEPSNCRWVTRAAQSRNRRCCITLEQADAIRLRAYYSDEPITEIAAELGVKYQQAQKLVNGRTFGGVGNDLVRPSGLRRQKDSAGIRQLLSEWGYIEAEAAWAKRR